MKLNNELITVKKDILDKILRTIDTSTYCADCLLYHECNIVKDDITCRDELYNLLTGGENHA